SGSDGNTFGKITGSELRRSIPESFDRQNHSTGEEKPENERDKNAHHHEKRGPEQGSTERRICLPEGRLHEHTPPNWLDLRRRTHNALPLGIASLSQAIMS